MINYERLYIVKKILKHVTKDTYTEPHLHSLALILFYGLSKF